MDQETSLLWQGPVWYAGRKSPVNAGSLPGLSDDIDLIEAYACGLDLNGPLPSVIQIDLSALPENEQADFFTWLDGHISRLPTSVPLIQFSANDSFISGLPKPDAVINRAIPDDVLFEAICAHQRALMRVEEASIRRLVFGRVPGYGSPAHYRGHSGLLVIGLGGRFLELQAAATRKTEVIGAFGQGMAEDYLSQRAFDAVILDSTLDDNLESLRLIRMDSRFAALPVLAVADRAIDTAILFRAGANDVLTLPLDEDNLRARLDVAIRFGKRRRLADRVLAESHKWLMQQLGSGGVTEENYASYLDRAGDALNKRGLKIWQMKLLPENFDFPSDAAMLAENLYSTVLSIADATSREEDLVCVVRDIGPVAVLKSERGMARLRSRVNAILSHTSL